MAPALLDISAFVQSAPKNAGLDRSNSILRGYAAAMNTPHNYGAHQFDPGFLGNLGKSYRVQDMTKLAAAYASDSNDRLRGSALERAAYFTPTQQTVERFIPIPEKFRYS